MRPRSGGACAGLDRPAPRACGLAAAAAAGILAFVAILVGFGPPATAAEAPLKAAVFPAELVDTSTEGDLNGARADETARLALVTRTLADGLAASGGYAVLDLGPAMGAIAANAPIRGCNGCDIDIARGLGADVAVIAVVQKVSNLILDVHLYVRDVNSGKVVRYGGTSIRGNTDESWTRGVRWLLRHRILAEPAAASAGP